MGKIALAIHGGAGTILRSQMTPALEAEYRGGLQAALETGWSILERGGASLDTVEAAVRSLEDFPLFNAGRGSVFTHEGEVELDAAIMDGNGRRAGGVTFVKNIRNPISLARLVMERTEHALLAGEGANEFAEQMGVETAPDEYFFTEHRWLQFQEALAAGRIQLDHTESTRVTMGTVGAVACDVQGRLASGTSTGGMTNKKFGRVGDSALIGAGTFANETCAVSCTGHGEFFMLGVTAYDVAARMKYAGQDLATAARDSIDYLRSVDGEGGLITVDAAGNVALSFNSEGMYRGYMSENGEMKIEIYGD